MGERTKANCDHVDLLFPSEYLKAGDLRGREVCVEIEDWDPCHEITGRYGEVKIVTLLHFRGKKKAWVLNPTNAKTIATLHGSKPSGWVGKSIYIKAERGRSFGDIADLVVVSAREPPPRREAAEPEAQRQSAEVSDGESADSLFGARATSEVLGNGQHTKPLETLAAIEMIVIASTVEELDLMVEGDGREEIFEVYARRRQEILTALEAQP